MEEPFKLHDSVGKGTQQYRLARIYSVLEGRNRFSPGALRFGNNFPVAVTAAKILTTLTVKPDKLMKGIYKV